MPKSAPRKKPAPKSAAQRKAAERRANRKPFVPRPPVEHVLREVPKPTAADRGPIREIPAEERFQIPELPEPADYLQVLVALAQFDPLAQEVMIAERIASLPSQKDGSMPVNIPRMVRPAWANALRKLGVFVIPELATHELVAPDGTGMMVNHTAGTMRQIDRKDMWDKAKAMNPELGELVDNADTPEKKRDAMRILAAKLPVEQRMAVERLMQTKPEDLEPS